MTSVVLMSFGPLSKWQYPCCLTDHEIKSGGQISMNIVYEKQKLNPKMTHQKLVTKGYSEQKTKKVKCSTHTHTHQKHLLNIY